MVPLLGPNLFNHSLFHLHLKTSNKFRLSHPAFRIFNTNSLYFLPKLGHQITLRRLF